MIAAALALIALFVFNERKVSEPIIAPHLIRNGVVVKAALFMFIFGIAMMGAMTYASMFSIYVLGFSVLDSAYYSLALVAGIMITSIASGALLERTGYRLWLCAGPLIAFAGLYMMSGMTVGTSVEYYVASLFVLGFGLGCLGGVIMTAVQNSSESSEIGMTTSAVNLIRSVGATIGSAIFAMVIANKIDGELFKLLPQAVYDIIPHNTGVLDSLSDPNFWVQVAILVPEQAGEIAGEILLAFANSVDFAFLTGGVLILLLVFIGIIFKVKKPRETGVDVVLPEEPRETE
jgi:fucose permease